MKSAYLSLLIILFATLPTLGQTEFVIANNNDPVKNSLTIFQLQDGLPKQVAALETEGKGFGNTPVLSNTTQGMTQNGECLFAMDAGSSDIAAFSKATGYGLVGDYSDSLLNSSYTGGGIALAPNGKFLYASYSYTENVGAWAVNSDCSLDLIGTYTPSAGGVGGSLQVAPNGQYLVVSIYGVAELFAIDGAKGSLADLGYLSFAKVGSCAQFQCFFYGLDVTEDSTLAVFAGETGGRVAFFTAEITPTGLQYPRVWAMPSSVNLVNGLVPFFSASAYRGSGNLYLGAQGAGDARQPAGIVVTSFSERPLDISFISDTVANAPGGRDGAIAVAGDTLVVVELPNQVATFTVNSDGSLTPLGDVQLSHPNAYLFSLSLFPNTR